MFNLGFGEMILLAAVALIFIGPKQLPQMAKILGRMLSEFKKAMNDVTMTVAKDIVKDNDLDIPKLIERIETPLPVEEKTSSSDNENSKKETS